MGEPQVKTAVGVLSAAAITALALTPAVASASTAAPGVVAVSSADPGGDPDTTVTFAVTSGELTMTAPVSADLGSGAPGTTINGNLGAVTVTDDRALLTAAWTTTAAASDFTTGGGTPAETVPATDVGYDPGSITTTGTITVTGTPITLSGTATPVVDGTAGVGNNTATWNPALAVAVPASAVGGIYTGTLTQSVS
jgi:hypothetical protein